jgi:excisionase family DNA binding protein
MAISIFAEPEQRLLTARQVAQRLGVCEWTVYQWAAKGRIPCIRMSRRALRFSEDDITKFEMQHTTGRL